MNGLLPRGTLYEALNWMILVYYEVQVTTEHRAPSDAPGRIRTRNPAGAQSRAETAGDKQDKPNTQRPNSNSRRPPNRNTKKMHLFASGTRTKGRN
jgi:hypothetical protein